VRENHFSLETAVLAADLEFLGSHLNNLQVRVFPANQLDRLRQLLSLRHRGRSEDGQFGRVVSQDIEQLSGGSRFGVFAEGSGFIYKQDEVFSIEFTSFDMGFPVGDFVLHDIFFFFGESVPVEHLVGAVRV